MADRITVDADALYSVLQALLGGAHEIRELQATRSLHKLGHPNPINLLIEDYEAATSPAAAPPPAGAQQAVAKCPDCEGSGVDGDVDDYGRTIDIACGACDGTGRVFNGWQAAIERVARVFQKSVIGMVPTDYATGYTEALEHVRRALAAPAAASETVALSDDDLREAANNFGSFEGEDWTWHFAESSLFQLLREFAAPAAAQGAVSAEDQWIEQTRHLNCPVCNGSGHVEDVLPQGDAAQRALLELLLLKDMKDKWEAEELSGFAYKSADNHRLHNEQRANYLRRKPLAWAAARKAFAATPSPEAAPAAGRDHEGWRYEVWTQGQSDPQPNWDDEFAKNAPHPSGEYKGAGKPEIGAWRNLRPLFEAAPSAKEGEAVEFPARILDLLKFVADRNPPEGFGAYEDGNGELLQDDADAGACWPYLHRRRRATTSME